MFSIFQYYIYHILENFDEQKFELLPLLIFLSFYIYCVALFIIISIVIITYNLDFFYFFAPLCVYLCL